MISSYGARGKMLHLRDCYSNIEAVYDPAPYLYRNIAVEYMSNGFTCQIRNQTIIMNGCLWISVYTLIRPYMPYRFEGL